MFKLFIFSFRICGFLGTAQGGQQEERTTPLRETPKARLSSPWGSELGKCNLGRSLGHEDECAHGLDVL